MKVSLKWLRDYVDITINVEELAAKLTAAGTEVAAIQRTGGRWEQVQVGLVTKVEPHPNADRLRLATVDVGPLRKTVVCGAPNIAEGQKIAFAHVGATLINGHTGEAMQLTAATIRGVVSEGMVCSEKELGLSEEHEGILVLPDDAPLGMPLSDYMGDVILDLDVTPNRPDCLSLLGVAREVCALTGAALKEPGLTYEESGPPATNLATIEIQDPDLCPRYTASVVTGLRIEASPAWMQERLLASGMRPINNVVDITNYVMLEVGQPLHAFDYDRLQDHRVVVRRARPGEQMTTLDGVDRTFTDRNLLITDPRRPVGVGGVIGGAESEVSAATTAVLLESANFNATNIRGTETALRVRTEASLRFDKGLHPHSAEYGLRRATKLLVEVCGGRAAPGIFDVYPAPPQDTTIHLTGKRLKTILGDEVPEPEVMATLRALGCEVAGGGLSTATGLEVAPPWWRPDLRIPDDLAEEVARIRGYDSLPTTSLRGAVPYIGPDPVRELREQAKDLLAAAGMQEIITYSLVSLASLRQIGEGKEGPSPIRVMNPMSTQQEYLRTSLRPGLLSSLAANERQAGGPVQLFECGRVYVPLDPLHPSSGLPEEREMVAGIVAGPAREPSWGEDQPPANYYTAKGLVESLLTRLGVDATYGPAQDPDLHPGRSAAITVDGDRIGILGEARPGLLARFDVVSRPAGLFELDLGHLLDHVVRDRRYRPISRFPMVNEDLAFVVAIATPASAVERAIRQAPFVVATRLFDVYSGPQVPPGKKSLAYSISYQAGDHTMSGEEIARARDGVIGRVCGQFSAELRT